MESKLHLQLKHSWGRNGREAEWETSWPCRVVRDKREDIARMKEHGLGLWRKIIANTFKFAIVLQKVKEKGDVPCMGRRYIVGEGGSERFLQAARWKENQTSFLVEKHSF